MPYITQKDRERINEDVECHVGTPGELNYIITSWCDDYLTTHGKNYTNINAIVGALECAKMELYRRIAAPYEDIKMIDNGDVYSNANVDVSREPVIVNGIPYTSDADAVPWYRRLTKW